MSKKFRQLEERTGTLSSEFLIALDQQVDSGIRVAEFSKNTRDDLILHFLAIYPASFLDSLRQGLPHQELVDKYRDAANILLGWIFKYSTPGAPSLDLCSDECLARTKVLFSDAISYSNMTDSMNILWNNWQACTVKSPSDLCLSFRGDDLMEMEYTDFRLGNNAGSKSMFQAERVGSLLLDLRFRDIRKSRFSFTLEDTTVRKVRDEIISPQYNWNLNDSWRFGRYSLGDFRLFWDSLCAYAFIHQTMCIRFHAQTASHPFDSYSPIRSPSSWRGAISGWSGLTPVIVQAILTDLSFDYALASKHKSKKIDSIYQPFIQLHSGQLALNLQAVLSSNPERNFMALQSCLDKDRFNNLTRQKEDWWTQLLIPLIEQRGFKCGKLNLDGAGNIDLLILDAKNREGLAVELKDLMAVDRIKPAQVNEVCKGIHQAYRSEAWLKSQSRITSIDGIDIDSSWSIRGLVVTRHHTFNAFLGWADAPVISEALFLGLLERNKSLGEIYQIAKEKKYSATVQLDFRPIEVQRKFGGVSLTSTAFEPLRVFDLKSALKKI